MDTIGSKRKQFLHPFLHRLTLLYAQIHILNIYSLQRNVLPQSDLLILSLQRSVLLPRKKACNLGLPL